MKNYVIYGAGFFGERILEFIPREDVVVYIDQNIEKQQRGYLGFPVLSLSDYMKKGFDYPIIIALHEDKCAEVKKMLLSYGLNVMGTYRDVQLEVTRERIRHRVNYIEIYRKAITWIHEKTIPGKGIICTTELSQPYPEVSGYYIPTLMRWGYKDLAKSYADWLCGIQDSTGAWYDAEGKKTYVFDTGQILKGLIEARSLFENTDLIDKCIVQACDWMIAHIDEEGRMRAEDEEIWGDGATMDELIHLYCLSPLFLASKIYGNEKYHDSARKCAEYYLTHFKDRILDFHLLSHFYAYVMEGLLDIGEVDLVKEAMDRIKNVKTVDGAVPAYKRVDWVCSTGLFQLALVWFRLGDIESGNTVFSYACRLQNESGGWFGSYTQSGNQDPNYFPTAEISWANKYFLDALYYKNVAEFNVKADTFKNSISLEDERYLVIESMISAAMKEFTGRIEVLDVGCGKGAYIKNLKQQIPACKYVGVDISDAVMKYLDDSEVDLYQGTLTEIPFQDHTFHVTYACESLEHAIDIPMAIKEMARVTKSGGYMIVVDKNIDRIGEMDIEDWEQWFGEEVLSKFMSSYCSQVAVQKEVAYEKQDYGLFYAWIGKVI